MDYKAHHYFADMGPRKVRQFAQLIRGKRADEALEALKFFPNRGARLMEGVLKSALGNAQDRGARDVDELIVIEARVDGGPMWKRIHSRARGMANVIKRRLAHIHVTVTDGQEQA
jgi:large subunit ribosomal protein L22